MKREKLQIKLSEVPEEGKTFTYSQSTGELTVPLKDLIDGQPYSVAFTIRPIGNVYEVKGSVDTSFPRTCSKCGWDIQIPIRSGISEILIEKAEEAKGDTSSKKGFGGDDDVSVTFISGGVLDAENMVHEVLGLQDPLYPSCEQDDCEHLKEVQRKLKELEEEADKALASVSGTNPFQTLKGLKF